LVGEVQYGKHRDGRSVASPLYQVVIQEANKPYGVEHRRTVWESSAKEPPQISWINEASLQILHREETVYQYQPLTRFNHKSVKIMLRMAE
tara:strand:- start:25 stop:297 length:273 start_codon:yes stop_codon:yes gene_type:complete